MTRLFIEGVEVELDENVQFAITKQFEDIQNPTTIINDWSKSVSIPATKNNNELFGHIYNPDRLIASGGSSLVGIYFDPTKKLNFRLEWDGDVLMTGYAKVIEIVKKDGKTTYEVTLNGELGKIFQELKKITFDSSEYATGTEEYLKYYIDGSQYVADTMNKTLVTNNWNSTGQQSSTLKKKGQSGYRVHDIIGFAPNNSYDEDFDYKTFQIDATTSGTFSNILGDSFKTDTGIDADTAIGDGLLPRDIGEYRSYLQLPFVFFNKLFQIFKEKGEALTGYLFDISDSWFSTNNPYWYKLVYMLKKLGNEKNRSVLNRYSSGQYTYTYPLDTATLSASRYHYDFSEEKQLAYTIISEEIPLYDTTTNSFQPYTKNPIFNNTTIAINTNVQATLNHAFQSDTTVRLSDHVGFVVKLYAKTGSSTVDVAKILIKDEDSTLSTEGYTYVYNMPRTTIRSIGSSISISLDNINVQLPNGLIEQGFSLWSKMDCIDDYGSSYNYVSVFQYRTSSSWGAVNIGPITYTLNSTTINEDFMPYIYKSGSKFILNDLWDNEYNLFSEILNYCKMYRIGIFCDTVNKKIIFKPLKVYFSDHTETDFTDKLDLSKEYRIKPITFDNKYTLFNYKDSETKIGKEYSNLFGLKYGEFKVITDYNFNTETKELFEGINQSIIYTDNVLSWTNLYERHSIEYSVPAEYYVHCYDDNKKYKSCFGSYYFFAGRIAFDTEERLHLRPIRITDDTDLQRNTNTFFYAQSTDGSSTQLYYPYLSNYIRTSPAGTAPKYGYCIFCATKKNYSTELIPNYTKSIYEKYWKNYLDERYNIQNKIVTCYLKLKPYDYINFDFNHFIKIENQLYMVNKIYDYDITSNESTKVDLITVQDINNYTTINE